MGISFIMKHISRDYTIDRLLFVIFQAEARIKQQNLDKEYLPISGHPNFCTNSISLALGDGNEAVANKLVSFRVYTNNYIFVQIKENFLR